MPAASYDILIEQGATYVQTFIWQDSSGNAIDVTGYTADMQVRASRSSTAILLEASTTNGYIVMGTTDGKINISVPAAVTGALTATRGVYDLELTSPGGVVTRLLEGDVEIDLAVTR
jgi:hypothetical protein